VRVGVDVGSVRVGVAASDAGGILATPVRTLARDLDGGADLRELAAIVHEREAVEVVVGLPRSLSGRDGPAAALVRAYAAELSPLVAPVPVRLVDERFSTVSAQQSLRGSGVRGRKSRQVIDQAAAVVILQLALDTERSTGRPSGEQLEGPG
jgi:putative Holliday junction resolvase